MADNRVPGTGAAGPWGSHTRGALLSDDEILHAGYRYFMPILAQHGLGEDDIDKQDLQQLQRTLQRLNVLIDDPTPFGVVRVHARPDSEPYTDVDAVSLLLQRKAQVLERIAALSKEEIFSRLKEAVEERNDVNHVPINSITDANSIVQTVRRELSEFEKSKTLQDEDLAATRAQQEAERHRALMNKVELTERKSEIYRSWIERESMASIVGALLLVGLGIALVVAMFSGTTPTEVITSAFLLILGYFFGQTTARPKGTKRSEDPP